MFVSGKRGSNPRPPAWEASALPTELLPQQFDYILRKCGADTRTRTGDPRITNALLYQLSHIGQNIVVFLKRDAKVYNFFKSAKFLYAFSKPYSSVFLPTRTPRRCRTPCCIRCRSCKDRSLQEGRIRHWGRKAGSCPYIPSS